MEQVELVAMVKHAAALAPQVYLVAVAVVVDTSAAAAVAADLPVLWAALVTTKVAAAAEPEAPHTLQVLALVQSLTESIPEMDTC
jgi:hypothetical protein